METRKRVVIVGGVAGGASCCAGCASVEIRRSHRNYVADRFVSFIIAGCRISSGM